MVRHLALLPLALVVLAAAFGPIFAGDPLVSDATIPLSPPSSEHWFGTDHLGRDIFARCLFAARLDLAIAFCAVAVSAPLGSLAGAAAGQRGGWPEVAGSRIADILMAFPLFVLALALVTALGNSVSSVVIATAVVNLPFYYRLARAEARVRRSLGYVAAARAGGSGDGRILLVFLLPGIIPLIAVQASVNLGWAMLNVAGLSFLGLGIRPPTPEWGVMVAEGARYIFSGEWWVALFPGLTLMFAVLGFNLAGDWLRDTLREPGR